MNIKQSCKIYRLIYVATLATATSCHQKNEVMDTSGGNELFFSWVTRFFLRDELKSSVTEKGLRLELLLLHIDKGAS